MAIAAVLDLVGIAWNFERSFLELFEGKGIDLIVVRAGTSNQLSSTLDQKLGDRLRAVDGRFTLCELNPTGRQVLATTSIDRLLPIYETEEEAIRSL